eukprot:190076_1
MRCIISSDNNNDIHPSQTLLLPQTQSKVISSIRGLIKSGNLRNEAKDFPAERYLILQQIVPMFEIQRNQEIVDQSYHSYTDFDDGQSVRYELKNNQELTSLNGIRFRKCGVIDLNG